MTRRGKEMLLLVLAVAALVVGVFTFRHKPAAQPGPAAPAAAPEGEKRVPEGQEPGENAGAAALQPGAEGSAARNPFAVPGTGLQAAAALEPMEGAPAGEGPPTEMAAAPATPEETAGPALSLAGIVAGQPSVAVIYQNGQRHFARTGDRIGDYRVQAIGRQEVVLVGGTGKLILRMGGRQ